MKDQMQTSTDQLIAILERGREGGSFEDALRDAGPVESAELGEMKEFFALSQKIADAAKIVVPESFMHRLLEHIPEGGGIAEDAPSSAFFRRAVRSPWTFGVPIMAALLAFVVVMHDTSTVTTLPAPLAVKQNSTIAPSEGIPAADIGEPVNSAGKISTFAALSPSAPSGSTESGPVASARTFAAPVSPGGNAEPKNADEIVSLVNAEAGIDSTIAADSDQIYRSLTSDTASLDQLEQAYDESDL